jgi:TolB-like protein/DNA-binding winged helix-turn-helix (wHTH) protein/tetratricopeptide (TPR) repeat protein
MSALMRDVYSFGPFRLDPAERELRRGHTVIPLTAKALDLLLILVRAAGRTLTKAELMAALWSDTAVEESNLSQTVFMVRKALGDDPSGSPYIVTIPRVGYKFAAEVTEEKEDRRSPFPHDHPATAVHRRWFAAALMVGVAGAGYWGARRLSAHSERGGFHSLAVLPFVNLSGDPKDEYLGDGITEEITHAVVGVQGLRVAARTSAFQFKSKSEDIRTIGKKLNVEAVLEGSMRRQGDKLRVTAQLNSVRDGYQLWSRTWDAEIRDVFAVERQISSGVVQTLLGSAKGLHSLLPGTDNLQAYQLYLQGRFEYRTAANKTDARLRLNRAIEIYQSAIALDPSFALPYAELSYVYSRFAIEGLGPRSEAYSHAKKYWHEALARNDSIAEAHFAKGVTLFYSDWDFRGAEQAFRRAIELDPSFADTYRIYASYLTAMARPEEAVRESELGRTLDVPMSNLVFVYAMNRQFEQAASAGRAALETGISYSNTTVLVNALLAMGRFDEALELWPRIEARTQFVAEIRRAFERDGPRGLFRAQIRQLEIEKNPESYANILAQDYARLGNSDRALQLLEWELEHHGLQLLWIRSLPAFDFMHEDPRYKAIVEKIGFPPTSRR